MKPRLSPGVKSPSRMAIDMSRFRLKGGFTIIELIVTVAIMSILAGVAVSSFSGLRPHWRLQGAANAIGHMFGQARFEAVKKNRPVLVQLSGAGSTSSSIALYRDNNRNDIAGDAGDDLISQVTIEQMYSQAYMASYQDCDGVASLISFGSDGTIKAINAAGRGTMPIVITMDSLVSTTPDTYQVVIQRSGIARVESGYTPGC